MTPREKATELLVFYYGLISGIDEVEREFLKNNFEKLIKQMGGDTFYWSKAIDASSKCVDEMVVLICTLDKPEYTAFLLKDKYDMATEYTTHLHGYEVNYFLEAVKQEILNYKSTIATTK